MIKQDSPSARRSLGRVASLTLFCFAFTCACPKRSWSQARDEAVQPMPQNPPNTQAQAPFDVGVGHAQARRFAEAAQAFSQSFSLGANRAALFAWAQSQRLAGRCEAAVPLYQRFVAVSEQPEETQAAKIGLRRCEETELRQQQIVQTRSRPPATTSQPHAWALAVTSGGLALITAGAIVALVSETERRAANRASTYEDHRAARGRAETQRWAALAAGSAGVAALAVGLWLYARPEEDITANGVSVAPLPNGSGLLMAWQGMF